MSLGAHLGPSWIATNVSDPWSSSALLHEPVTAGNMPPPPYHYPTSLGASSESIPLPSSTTTINHSSATTNALDYIFTTLRSRDTHERQGAAQQLRNLVSAARSRLSEDARGDLYGTLTKRVSELGAFNNPAHYRLGAMAAISSTVDLIEASAISRYLTTIRFNLPTNNMEVMEAANLALGVYDYIFYVSLHCRLLILFLASRMKKDMHCHQSIRLWMRPVWLTLLAIGPLSD